MHVMVLQMRRHAGVRSFANHLLIPPSALQVCHTLSGCKMCTDLAARFGHQCVKGLLPLEPICSDLFPSDQAHAEAMFHALTSIVASGVDVLYLEHTQEEETCPTSPSQVDDHIPAEADTGSVSDCCASGDWSNCEEQAVLSGASCAGVDRAFHEGVIKGLGPGETGLALPGGTGMAWFSSAAGESRCLFSFGVELDWFQAASGTEENLGYAFKKREVLASSTQVAPHVKQDSVDCVGDEGLVGPDIGAGSNGVETVAAVLDIGGDDMCLNTNTARGFGDASPEQAGGGCFIVAEDACL